MGLLIKHKTKGTDKQRESGEVFEDKLPCPSCSSSDAFVIYQRDKNVFDGYCFSCEFVDYDPYCNSERSPRKAKPKKRVDSDKVASVARNHRVREIKDRGITKDTCQHFNVRVGVARKGNVTHHFYPRTKAGVLTGYKVRVVEGKEFFALGKVKSCDMFGHDQAINSGSRILYVTEGECDAMALYQTLKSHLPEKWKHIQPAVVSLKDGASSAVKSIQASEELLEVFQEIVLVFDQDKPGKVAARKVSKILDMPVKVAKLTRKDPNEMLMEGLEKQLNKAVVFDAKVIRPDGIKTVEDLYEAALVPVKIGVNWPWPSLTAATYGRRTSELIIIGGGSGCGKTEVLKECIQQDTEEGRPVGVMFLEESGARTVKVLAGKRVNKRFHIPGDDWSHADLVNSLNELREENLLNIYDSSGIKDWDEIRAKIRWWVVGCHIKTIYLDHLTALTASESDERKALDIMLAEMSSLCEDLSFTLVVISHLTRPDKSRKSHEEGGRVRMADFRGSGAIGFWAHYMIGVERNTQSEDADERNTVTLRVIKDRYTGNATGNTIKLFFDHSTGRLLEPDTWDDTVTEENY